MEIYKYTPCRITECFLDENEEIEVFNKSLATIKLKGFGRIIWNMLDGKHSIYDIAEKLCVNCSIKNKEKLLHELMVILKVLENKGLIVINWNPLYKISLNQELNI